MADQQDTGDVTSMGVDTPTVKKDGILHKIFGSCAADPRGSVHRAWGISLLFVVVYFSLSIFESKFGSIANDVLSRLSLFGCRVCVYSCSLQYHFENIFLTSNRTHESI
jgi:hypothetical protein